MWFKRALLVAVLALPFAAQPSKGAECPRSATQIQLNECAGRAYATADAQLKELYRQIETRLKGDRATRDRLGAAQRAWVAFRDAECAFAAASVVGGSIYPFEVSTCLEALTIKRNADLTAYLTCSEGDPACPVPPR